MHTTTHPTTTLQHPQYAIRDVVEKALLERFDFEWEARVVRQTRQYSVGSLPVIDFAVPCFELARHLKMSPEAIASEIATVIAKQGSTVFKSEAVNGYLNFMLSEDYFQEAQRAAARWYRQPRSLASRQPATTFLLTGSSVVEGTPDTDLTTVAHAYISRLYSALHHLTQSVDVVGDFSAETLKLLAATGVVAHAKRLDVLEQQQAHMAELRRQWQAAKERVITIANLQNMRVFFESELAEKTHEFLDALPAFSTDQDSGLVKDIDTGAVYFMSDQDAVPLRAATGLLYDLAYELYVFDALLHQMAESKGSVVVVAPQRLHPIFKAYAAANTGDYSFAMFDPKVSRADIVEIEAHGLPPEALFEHFAEYLESPGTQNHESSDIRAGVLTLIDLPVELSRYLTQQRYPALFDALNQSYNLIHTTN